MRHDSCSWVVPIKTITNEKLLPAISKDSCPSLYLVSPLAALRLFAIVHHASYVHVHFVVDLHFPSNFDDAKGPVESQR